jgi:hypothetical protein
VAETLRWGASRQIVPDGMVSSGFQQGLVHLMVRVSEGDSSFEKVANASRALRFYKSYFELTCADGLAHLQADLFKIMTVYCLTPFLSLANEELAIPTLNLE